MKYINISHNLNLIERKIHFLLGYSNYISAFWWKVKIGNNIKFSGKTYFYRFPNSKIIIGDKCRFLSRPFANRIGINRSCMISTHTNQAIIEIGQNCGFSGTVIGSFIRIKIGNNVRCGANTLISDSDWHPDDYRSGNPREVLIEDNVWIGEGVKVLKGVIIGKNSLIGAGSVVTKSIPANVIAAGNPCKVVRSI